MRAKRGVVLATLCLALPACLGAQQWLGIQGAVDIEVWRSGGRSIVLTRDDPTVLLGRAYALWAVEPRAGVQLIALTEVEAATDEDEVELELDHFALRLTPSPLFTADVGRFALPIGGFAGRRFSGVNPLIGRPDGYSVMYPWGVQISGGRKFADYRVAVVSLPVTNEAYLPAAGHSLRPALSVGVTPLIGLRVGGSWTMGPYLSDSISNLPLGSTWRDYWERIFAADLRFARGYFELFAELAASYYEVPTRTNEVKGTTYYVEAKYAWSPRLFTAARFERNLYAFIRHNPNGSWTAQTTDFDNTEVGVGYRVTPRALVKVSGRWDAWEIPPGAGAFLGEGWAVALQISYRFGG